MVKLYSQAVVIVLAMGVLVGCGQVPALSTAVSAMRDPGEFGRQRAPKLDGPLGLLSVADLSEAQKAQLKAIAEKHKPQKPALGGAELEALLAADPLDAAALRSALEARVAPPAEAPFAALAEARAVLTEAQRAELVAKLKAQPSPAPHHEARHPATPAPPAEAPQARLDRLAEKLGLDPAQKAAFATFQAQLEAARPAPTPRPDFARHRDAMVAFIETGDTAALEALHPKAERAAFPVDAFIALAQSLRPDQRKLLLARPKGHAGLHHR